MVKRSGRREPGKVRLALHDRIPVAPIGGRRTNDAAQAFQPGPVQQRDPRGDYCQHHEQCGQQPARPPNPEIAEMRFASNKPSAEQQISYEVAAESKEHANTEQAAWCPAELLVECDDSYYRDRA